MLLILKFNAIEFTFRQDKNCIVPFLLLLVKLSNFLIIPVVKEKLKVRLTLSIARGAPTTLVKVMIGTPPLALLKTIQILSM